MSSNIHPDIVTDMFGATETNRPMTSAQNERLRLLGKEKGRDYEPDMSEDEAEKMIADLDKLDP